MFLYNTKHLNKKHNYLLLTSKIGLSLLENELKFEFEQFDQNVTIHTKIKVERTKKKVLTFNLILV